MKILKKISPSILGSISAIFMILIWLLSALQSKQIYDPNTFIIVVLNQGLLAFFMVYSCSKLTSSYAFYHPRTLLWIAHSLNYFRLYTIGNLAIVIDPSSTFYFHNPYALAPSHLWQSSLFVLLSYVWTYYFTIIFLYPVSKFHKKLSFFQSGIYKIFCHPVTIRVALLATLAIFAAGIRVGPYYNSQLLAGAEESAFDVVSPIERIFYITLMSFPSAPSLVVSLCALFNPKLNSSKRGLTLSIAAGVLSLISFSLFRMRSWAILSSLFMFIPLLKNKTGRRTFFFASIPLMIITYGIVTSLRLGAAQSLTDSFDLQTYLSSAITGDALVEKGVRDTSSTSAGLGAISVAIFLQLRGLLTSQFGFQFLFEFLGGLPTFMKDIVPEIFRTRTEYLIFTSLGTFGDMVEVPLLPFLNDFFWPIAAFFTPLGFVLLLQINSLIVRLTKSFPQCGFVYIAWLFGVSFSSHYVGYASSVKSSFFWFVICLCIASFTPHKKSPLAIYRV